MRKGQATEIFYIIFLIFMIVVVFLGFILIPGVLLNKSIQVAALDNTNTIHRFQNKLSYKDPFTLRSYPLSCEDADKVKEMKLTDFFNPGFSKKKWAFKITFGEKERFYNQRLFEIQTLVAPLGEFYKTNFQKELICSDDLKLRVQLEQILPKVYYVE